MHSVAKFIDRKRQDQELTDKEIQAFIEDLSAGNVTDAQLGGFTMAVCFNGMTRSEQTSLTLAMRDSGSVLRWDDLNGPVLDKHSTGGVGDWVSIALAPMIAACGGFVPMISGRGLGHTGGTLDKLESIPGYSVQMPLDKMQKQVQETGMAMIGQGPEVAPADGRIYAVRDVTATVESIPLIVSSILAKKLAEGLDGLVLDVKTGNGAFMQAHEHSRSLAQNMCETAKLAGTHCRALITDMNQPLAHTAGNALEMHEAIDFLEGGHANPKVEEVIYSLAAEMLLMGKLVKSRAQGKERLRSIVDSGHAAECFARNVVNQGGPIDLLENREKYRQEAPVVRPVLAESGGWIAGIDTRAIGLSVVRLGGGRIRVEDTIDARVGISGLKDVGEQVSESQVLCMVHASTESAWERAAEAVKTAIRISDESCDPLNVIHELIEGANEE